MSAQIIDFGGKKENKKRKCSFCGKEVFRRVETEKHCICDKCIEKCKQLLKQS